MTLVVGFAPGKSERSALDLAATFARSSGQDLLVVSVVPAPWPTPVAGHTDREYVDWARERGAKAVAEAEALLASACPEITARAIAVPGRSIPGTLADQAEKCGAAMIVVGSGSDGSWGKVVVSTTADRLLHSSPVAVALAPRGYRPPAEGRIGRATCAFRGDESSHAALVRTAEICRDIGASLRVATFGVLGRTMYPPEVLGEDLVLSQFVEQSTQAQAAAIEGLREQGTISDVDSVVATGHNWSEALEGLPWERDDVLVVGSSSTNLLARVFLGSNASKIMRHSPVPVVVVH
ncbi:universal stress protein [Nocardioides sp.]|uniref:universal stress protein n=1 Tax=Nocardioides sp. TaxID=35761 RepID=UPI003D0CD10B